MERLRRLYEDLGFRNVTTYLQSGNVVFTAQDSEDKLEQKISRQIEIIFGFEVPVIVMTIDSFKKIIDNNPFLKDPTYLYITFLAKTPETFDPKSIEDKKLNGEELSFSDNAVYLFCLNGYGTSKLSNSFLESKLKVTATTRNWKTSNELLKIAQQII